jgi:hypothetical protein
MSDNTHLRESVSAEPVKKGKRWLVTLAVPGQGNSGYYSPEVLESYGPVAIAPKTKAYWGHADPQDRDARDALGKYPEGAFWNAEEQKLQAYLEPYPRWDPIIEEMGSDLELSMCILDGEKDGDGNVLRMGYHRANTVDAVAFAGLSGSGLLEQVESLAESLTLRETSAREAQEKEGKKVDEKLDKLIALFESFIGESKAKAKDEAQVVADEAAAKVAATAAVEAYASNIALVEAARETLLPSQVASLQESARTSDVASFTASVDSAKKVAEEAKSAVLTESVSAGRDFGTKKFESAADLGKVFG